MHVRVGHIGKYMTSAYFTEISSTVDSMIDQTLCVRMGIDDKKNSTVAIVAVAIGEASKNISTLCLQIDILRIKRN